VATVSVKAPPAAAEGASEAASDAGAALGAVDSAAVDAAAVGAELAPPPDEQAAATSRAATSPEALVKFVIRIELNMGRLLDLKDVLDHSPGDALQYVEPAAAGFAQFFGSLTVRGLIPIMALGIRSYRAPHRAGAYQPDPES
jgi:hypothetical protein